MTTVALERTLTELDHVRLTRLMQQGSALPPPIARQVGDLLDAAQVVPSRTVEPDVVTMYSQVLLLDPGDGATTKLTLCYPADAEPAAGFISVLSPVGRSLLGRRVGERAQWHTVDGRPREAEIVALLFQPESSGDYTL